jgi:hypothetical protein
MNLVTPKAGAEHDLLFNEKASVQQKLMLSSSFRGRFVQHLSLT